MQLCFANICKLCIYTITIRGYYSAYNRAGQSYYRLISYNIDNLPENSRMHTTEPQNSQDRKTRQLVITALMICLVVLGTILFRIPVPMTKGYIHLGDAMIYLAVLMLGKKHGSAAACLGSALGDILGGYAFWAPFTLVIKFAMSFIAGSIIETYRLKHEPGSFRRTRLYITAMTAGGLVMCAGYLLVERFMYGGWAPALIGVPWNIGQFAAGIVIALAVYQALSGILPAEGRTF